MENQTGNPERGVKTEPTEYSLDRIGRFYVGSIAAYYLLRRLYYRAKENAISWLEIKTEELQMKIDDIEAGSGRDFSD